MVRRLAAVLAVAVLAGCGGAADRGSSTDASIGAQGAGPEVLRFSAPIVGGGQFDASTLAGRPAAFWFWAPT